MGGAAATELRHPRVFSLFFFLLVVSFTPPALSQTQDEVIFNVESTYHMEEEQPAGTAVVQLEAYYVLTSPFQLGADGVFELDQSQSDSEFFTIDFAPSPDGSRTLGMIRNAAVMDRDVEGAQTAFSLTVTYSTPDSYLSAQNTLTILLSDVNDNAPQFSQEVYFISLLEAAGPGSLVLQLTATDADEVLTQQLVDEEIEDFAELVYLVDNGRIFYSISAGNDEGLFEIDLEGGAISVSSDATFDIDLQESYSLTVVATDAPGLNTTAEVLVNILDSNDNPPQILAPRGLNFTLSEDTPPGLVIVDSINATDDDHGLNAEIEFLILSGDETNSFSIDPLTGRISLSAPLDREGGTGGVVTLVIAAQDQGIPPLQDTISIVVVIDDVNDFAPQFTEVVYEASVREGVRSGFGVTRVIAEDGDEGLGGVVSYYIIEGGEGNFYIDSVTGDIFTNATFDREERSEYQLVVAAVDNPINESFQLSSSVNVTIAIEDRNDNEPVFNSSVYEVHILDNHTRGYDVISVVSTDSDEGVNAEITYEFVDPLPSNSQRFRIGETTGLVEVHQRPRYDIQPCYNYTVRALDGGSPSLHSDVLLMVFIHDVDETPPTFEQEAYNVTLDERVPIGTVVLQVIATDPDPGPIGEVHYRIITEFDAAGSFAVDRASGNISVKSRLDFDTRNFTFFQVEAYDEGFPEPFTDLTNVTIFLVGANDEPPSIIFPEGFFPTVPEDEPRGYDIVYLTNYTTDPDIGAGGEFNFSLFEIYDPLSEGGNDSFSLNSTTGLLRGLRVFDREEQPQGIVVAIETTDFGDPPQSIVTNITVMIGDKNDQTPYFPFNLSIVAYELLPPGVQILDEFRAIDEDIGINAELEYNISDGDPRGEFSIDPQTGGLFAEVTLNKSNQTFYNLTILARDKGTPPLQTFGYVQVEVIDSNDNVPMFTMGGVYVANVSENEPVGTLFFQVNATDADEGTNADVQYFLNDVSNASAEVNSRFSLDPSTGELFTNDVFDRENNTSFLLHVVAIDNGTVPARQTGSASVLVTIADRNDHTPSFHNVSYTADITENAPNGTHVFSVSASDEDAESPNNEIIFSLNGTRSDVFQIDPTSGDVTVAMEVDWEEGGVINITVIATDMGEPTLSSTADVTIFIEDVNDRSPDFPPGSLSLGILENTDPPAPVTPRVMTVDLDSPGNGSVVTYEVINDLADGRFVLDSETGEVTFVRGVLNRERRPFYEMLIRAQDHGDPPLHTDALLTIFVLDTNDFDPVFTKDPFTGSVSENEPPGTKILTLEVTDMDTGTNAELSFFILESSGASGMFYLNDSSGELFTGAASFDFEFETNYSLAVMVTDHGIPPRNHTSQVAVTITDFNDNLPTFFAEGYSSELEENLSPYTTVLQVAASDADSDNNAIIRFSLAAGEGSEYFGIDPETGVLHTTRFINREVTPRFNLTIVANNSLSSRPSWSTVQAEVTVLDLPDTHPSFDVVTHIYLEEDAAVGTGFNLSATDGDEGLAGVIHYDVIHGNNEGFFHLDPTTGSVTLTTELDFEAAEFHEFVVSATDMATPNLTNYTTVLVHVVDVNDNQPRFVSSEYTVTIDNLIPVGTEILNLVAEDADSGTNSDLEYGIEEGSELFALQSNTQPSLSVTQSLEHHVGLEINLVVTVQNPGSDAIGRTNVTIHIQEALSTLPLFSQLFLESSVMENQVPLTVLQELSLVTSNAVRYEIKSGNVGGVFAVDNAGTLSLAPGAMLDHETTPTYQLTIKAENVDGDASYRILTISVEDVNDIPPSFISSSFLIHIPETTPVGVPFFVAIATDNDGTSPANEIEIDFHSTVSVAVENTFAIDPSTGEISLGRNLDFEDGDRNFMFEISASNDGAFVSVATVSVVVVNGNNHVPEFTSVILEPVTLFEDQRVGLSIFNASAVDGDEGTSGEITFGLRGNHRYYDFSIDTTTGEVILSGELDRERQTQYQLVIVAADRGNPGLTSTSLLVVGVLDINDNTPEWDELEYSVYIHENTSVGTEVILVEATDIDQVDFQEENGEVVYYGTNGLVHYSITDGDPREQFFIEPLLGQVIISAPLDREVVDEYLLTLTATDGGGRAANASLFIRSLDINDVTPFFSQDEYVVAVPENSENGTFVVNISATDTDLSDGSFFYYDIESGNIDEVFTLNSSTGSIWLEFPLLDREDIPVYNITVIAIDLGDPSLTGTAQVIVHLLDENEFPPVFDQEAYHGFIPENASLFSPILTVNTSDLDYMENSTSVFSIVSDNNGTMFEIDSLSGQLFVSGDLDFENTSEYYLVVMARDSGPISTQLSTEVNVTVVITDVNDNIPTFLDPIFVSAVREDAPPLAPLIVLEATDEDSGDNAEIVFSLDPLGDNELFVLDPQTGLLTLSPDASLDYEIQQVYEFNAIAADSGSPQLSSNTTVTIVIEDVNDNAPIFESPVFYATVVENSAPGPSVIYVTASDADSGENAELTYDILRQIENETDCYATCLEVDVCTSIPATSNLTTPTSFVIHNQSGLVTTSLPLDREERETHLLVVQATDSGRETRLSSLTCLLVTVLDENDETPTFPEEGYEAEISEFTGEGVRVVEVLALDGDKDVNAEVRYEILGESSGFAVHPDTGEVATLGGYDREVTDRYDVIVLATDGGDLPLNSTTVVRVTITDENDNAPQFEQSEYSVSFPENQPPFSPILLLRAIDNDIGSNADLAYSIESSLPQDHFIINSTSGLLQSTVPLDREEITSYSVTIISTDMGNPPLSSTAQVTITVTDANDHAPIFTESEYFISINENFVPEYPIIQLAATDDDSGTNSFIQFYLNGTSPQVDSIAVNSTSGAISVLSPLDAEISLSYTLTVEAVNDRATPQLATEVNVIVAVGDLNDHTPLFSQPEYVITVIESVSVGSEVIDLNATDADATETNSELRFEIVGGQNHSLFYIDPQRGSIFTVAPLDRESEPLHTLQVRVSDNGTEPRQRESHVNVTFVLQDSNDNFPVFDQSSYLFTVYENEGPGVLIGRVRASDVDLQSVTYSITAEGSGSADKISQSGSGSSMAESSSEGGGEGFSVNSTTGEIFTAVDFDREQRDTYTFLVTATDNGTFIQHSSLVVVRVEILDQNDVPPSFSLPNYTAAWPEDTLLCSTLLTVVTYDPDLRESGVVEYLLHPSNDSAFFSVNSTSGTISLIRDFDRETQDYFSFEVIAQDFGEPRLTSSVVVVVTVLDINDNIPQLNSSQYSAVLHEDTPVDSILIGVAAGDDDISSNAEIVFSLSSNFDSMFTISDQSGLITLSFPLDFERDQNYTFFVVATDNGDPPLSSSSEVTIIVTDLNDNPPIFASDTYQTSIPENAILGTSVFQIPATDADSTSNAELHYSILSGNLAAAFQLDERRGLISLQDHLDREVMAEYTLALRVVDQGTPQFTAQTELLVQIGDVNDHIPEFGSDVYHVSIPEQSGIGTTVGVVEATDADVGINGDLTYSIIAGDPDGKFSIDPHTGEVLISQRLDFEAVPFHSLTVLVSDRGQPVSHSSTVILSVSVLDDNEYPPSYPQSHYIIDVPDNTPPGALVGSFPAGDRDTYQRSSLLYSLDNYGNASFFSIEPYTGDLYTLSLLPSGEELYMSIVASDGLFTATVGVTVTVFPLSSSLPIFQPSPSFLFSISEDTSVGETVGMLTTTDDDVIISLVNDSSVNIPFEVSSNGEINLIGQLDYETAPTWLFSVRAVSTLNSSLVSQTVVVMEIDDANDNPPLFQSDTYSLIVLELTPVSSLLLTVTAYDLDPPGVNSDVEFSITGGNEGSNFDLDPLTGELIVASSLDYEEQQGYVLNVSVTNSRASPPLSSEGVVWVELVDENDHAPQFGAPHYQATVSSSAGEGTPVLTLTAEDADSGSNSDLSFFLTHLDHPLSFTVDHSIGVISTGPGFREDVESYVLLAAVSDKGSPQPQSDTATIYITLVPDNNFDPQFSSPGGYAVTIPETLPFGGSVVQISASDPDTPDSLITYSIAAGDPGEIFIIDPSIGLISLVGGLDYNSVPLFELSVTAKDSGTPPRNASVSVNISVTDVNNHAPLFPTSHYTISILENTTVGSSIANITATDVDADSITYILSLNSYAGDTPLFSLDNETGILSTSATVDRELKGTHRLLVSAVDSGYPIRLSNSVPVTVVIIDLNDTPPQFDQLDYVFSLLRYLAPGVEFAKVTATDSDLIGQPLEYDIVGDTSGGVIGVNSTTGVMFARERVPEESVGVYELTVAVYDGEFVTTVPVTLELTSDGFFCEASGLCTDVDPVNCSFIQFGSCDPRILGALYNPFCTHNDFELTPDQYLCVRHYCEDPLFYLCLPSESCLPPNLPCDGQCPAGTSLCPTTNLCHVTSLSESCDGTNVTCLIGQILAETADFSRECLSFSTLPQTAQDCSDYQLYCIATDECANITSPPACPYCPPTLTLCPDTKDCVPNAEHCCGTEGFFCDVLSQCLAVGEICKLPNVPPIIFTPLIHLPNLDRESGDSHVISVLLSNGNNSTAVDSQGEELSIAIVETSDISEADGEWQYGLCSNQSWLPGDGVECGMWEWSPVGVVSETQALVLPSTAQVRFLRLGVVVEGVVWMKVKLWDGNQDGFLSSFSDLVRYSLPHHLSTLPFSHTGPFSENTMFITALLLPLLPHPSLPISTPLTFLLLTEDTPITGNPGNTVEDLVLQVVVPELPVLPDDIIHGLPDGLSFAEFESHETEAVREYFDGVERVNPIRQQRQAVVERGLGPGIGIRLDSKSDEEVKGQWQVSRNGDVRQYVYVNSLLTSTNQILLLNTTARIRFVPNSDFCGTVSIPFQPWDGVWNETETSLKNTGFLVTKDTALSEFNLNDVVSASQTVECIPDKPVLLVNQLQLEPIPYFVSHTYDRLFTLIVSVEMSVLRGNRERLSELLHLVLEEEVSILRIAGHHSGMSSQVSVRVEEDRLSFSELESLLLEKTDVLSDLGFPISLVSQTAYYGPGEGCSSSLAPQPLPGTIISSITNQNADDSDGEVLGLAVVSSSSVGNEGVWQYLRGNWSLLHRSTTNTNLSDFSASPHEGPWINFPPELSESRALLLHPTDRLRFLPKPSFFWSHLSLPPSLSVKAWDLSVGKPLLDTANEAFLAGINTDPYVDTTQSLFHTIGLFSDGVAVLNASRLGCDDVIDSGFTFDPCCVCGGDGETCVGCDGVGGSGKMYGHCDTCGGEGGCEGCDLVPFSFSETGACGECVSVVSVRLDLVEGVRGEVGAAVVDCEGMCLGRGVIDDCGDCVPGDSAHLYNSNMDCTGVCEGNATVDDCGYCTGPGTTLAYNWNLDCTEVCGGPFRSDSCGICQLPEVVEHRDCLGDCFGTAILDECGVCHVDPSSPLVGSSLDVCGVCGGQNSTCFGCDGSPASGVTVDSCGVCGGNDCGCFKIDSIEPQWGPKSGGTEIIVRGAGFFLNDSSIKFDPQSENCGAPRVIGGESISAACRFESGQNNDITADDVIIVNQSTIRCITKATTTDLLFELTVSIANEPQSNSVIFRYYDDAMVTVSEITPADTEVGQITNVSYHGNNFDDTGSSVCFLYLTESCGIETNSGEDPLIIPVNYISENEVVCIFPAATAPCEVTVQLSQDGQMSGVVISVSDLVFTYRYSPPAVEQVRFSRDLSDLLVQFDRPVELVASSDGGTPDCNEVFSLASLTLLGDGASCYWQSSQQDVLGVNLPSSAAINIHSSLLFQPQVLVTRGQEFSYSVSDSENFPVDPTLDYITPVAIVDGPRSIPVCGEVSFTGVHSLNPGYGGMSYRWSVLTEDSTTAGYQAILNYLDSLEPDTHTISLSSDWFSEGIDYYLELVVVNSAGGVSPPTILTLPKETEETPRVFVLGQDEREIQEGEGVLLEAAIFTPSCFSEEPQISYLWKLYQLMDERRMIFSPVTLTSVPSSSPVIHLPSSLLSRSSLYTVSLTGTFHTPIPTSDTVNVSLSVIPRPLDAVIHGGDRSVSENRNLILDARESVYDSTSPAPSTFSWQCNEVASGGPCYNRSQSTPTPILIPDSDLVSIPGSDMEPGLTYNFTVALSQSGRLSYDSVVITVTRGVPPIVEVVREGGGEGVSSHEVVIQGLVYSSTPLLSLTWESVLIEGQGYVDLSSLSLPDPVHYPPSVSLTHTTSFNLILPPNSLPPHLTHTFQLTAVNEAGASSSRVSITVNPSPHSAAVVVSPTTGVALETIFTICVDGTLDEPEDTPFLYQFGINEGCVVWLTGIQVEPCLQTILTSGLEPGHNLSVVARVFDRSGGFADVWTLVTVEPSASVSEPSLRDLLNSLQNQYTTTRNWQHLLSYLTSIAMEISSTPSLSLVQQQALSLFLEVFSEDLPATHTHYQLAAQLLSLLTTYIDPSLTPTSSLATLNITSFFKSQATILTLPVADGDQNNNEPLQLLPVEGVVPPSSRLPISTATSLLATWSQLLSSPDTPTNLLVTSAEAVQDVGLTLCQGMVYGEAPSLATSSLVELVTYKAPPTGMVNIGENVVEYGVSLEDSYSTQACPQSQQTCYETCLLGVKYSSDLFIDDNFKLAPTAEEQIILEIEGSHPQATELVSSVLSLSVPIPSQNGFLVVANSEQEIVILFRVRDEDWANGSIPLCVFREFGGGHGFSNHLWQIESTFPPSRMTIDSVVYYQCNYSHLTEFAVGLLPPPVIPPPPSPTPTPSPSPPPSPSPTPTPISSPTEPPAVEQTGISPGVVAVPIILVLLIVAAAVCVVVIFLVWRKKKNKVLKISPGEGPSGEEGRDGRPLSKRIRTGPLTPEESKVPMPIIELQEGGKRAVVGSMSVLPSIRLRELRYHIHDQFADFKGKPFYFLTRQLVDIEPPTEQQQFVSLVYGDEADKPIFIRRVDTTTQLTTLHFCVCGNVAQFECSSCSVQGYCSPECQTSDWVERHQKECGRLSEKKQRMSILGRRPSSSALSPVDEENRLPSIFPERHNTSAATPLDFRSLLHSQRSYQRSLIASPPSLEPSMATPSLSSPAKPPLPPLTTPRNKPTLPPLTTSTAPKPALPTPSRPGLPPFSTPHANRTTLSMLAGQTHPPTIQEENEEEEDDQISPMSTQRPLAPRTLGPFTTTPGRPSFASPGFTPSRLHTLSPHHSTPITTPQPHSLQLFTKRADPALQTPKEPFQQQQQRAMGSKKISIQSLGGPEEYSLTSPPARSLRQQPHLRTESDDSSSEESESEESTTPSTPGEKPASTKKASSPSSSSSSSSSSGSEESEDESTPPPSTPLVTDHH